MYLGWYGATSIKASACVSLSDLTRCLAAFLRYPTFRLWPLDIATSFFRCAGDRMMKEVAMSKGHNLNVGYLRKAANLSNVTIIPARIENPPLRCVVFATDVAVSQPMLPFRNRCCRFATDSTATLIRAVQKWRGVSQKKPTSLMWHINCFASASSVRNPTVVRCATIPLLSFRCNAFIQRIPSQQRKLRC